MFENFREDINCVFDRDPAARNVIDILTTYPGVHAVLHYRMTHGLWRLNLKWLARVFSAFSRFLTGVEIHPGATIGKRFFIDHGMGVVIGETAKIGNDCTLYHGVTLGGTSWQEGKRHPTLEDNVVVGAGAKILGPITIGEKARIGSNAVVVKNVHANTTVVGIPGREVIQRGRRQNDRDQLAKKIGFDAYGTSTNMPDPIANSMNKILDHLHLMDKRVESLCAQVHQLGGKVDESVLPSVERCFNEEKNKAV
ncbi:MAG TPA: serine O-acetyltransferase [Thiotrichaceae bacterium]|nr:serine O-acetyltransferase [Thiotrichaceae bacterium]